MRPRYAELSIFFGRAELVICAHSITTIDRGRPIAHVGGRSHSLKDFLAGSTVLFSHFRVIRVQASNVRFVPIAEIDGHGREPLNHLRCLRGLHLLCSLA